MSTTTTSSHLDSDDHDNGNGDDDDDDDDDDEGNDEVDRDDDGYDGGGDDDGDDDDHVGEAIDDDDDNADGDHDEDDDHDDGDDLIGASALVRSPSAGTADNADTQVANTDTQVENDSQVELEAARVDAALDADLIAKPGHDAETKQDENVEQPKGEKKTESILVKVAIKLESWVNLNLALDKDMESVGDLQHMIEDKVGIDSHAAHLTQKVTTAAGLVMDSVLMRSDLVRGNIEDGATLDLHIRAPMNEMNEKIDWQKWAAIDESLSCFTSMGV